MIFLNALLAAAALSGPLQPNGPWTVAYEESMCLAARKYGPKGDVAIGFRPAPLSDRMEISIDVSRWPGRLRWWGQGQIKVAPGEKPIDVTYTSFAPMSRHASAIVINAANDVLTGVKDGSVLTVDIKPSGSLSIRMTNVAKVKAALADCRNVLLKHWNVDTSALAKLTVLAKPIGDMASWITPEDYPKSSALKGERGDTIILWTIGKEGSASDCRVIRSSGSPILDDTACRAILRSARYEPARGQDGKPAIFWESRRIRWVAFRR